MVPLRDRDRGEGIVLGVKCGENAAWKNFRPRLKIKSFPGRNEKFLGWFSPSKTAKKEKRITQSSQKAPAHCLRPMLLVDFVVQDN
jgi:hypothetical protein